jgi:hypothetical protein
MNAPLKLGLLALSASLGCSQLNTPIYFNAPEPLELQGDEDPPRIMNSVTLRFRQPSQDERDELNARAAQLKAADPLGRDIEVPWVSSDKVHLEVLFTVRNLDTQEGTFDVTLDGASEFIKYDHNVVAMAQEEDEVLLPLLTLHPQLPYVLGPGQTFRGILREDDLQEAQIDLDAMGRWPADPADMEAAPPFPAVLFNRSNVTPPGQTGPLGMSGVPPVVVTPALMEVDVTFSANRHMICEWTLRVRDDDDRLLHVEGDQRFNPSPTLFAPMVAATP